MLADAETVKYGVTPCFGQKAINEEDRVNFRLRFVVPEDMLVDESHDVSAEQAAGEGLVERCDRPESPEYRAAIQQIFTRLLGNDTFLNANLEDLDAIEAQRIAEEADRADPEDLAAIAALRIAEEAEQAELMMANQLGNPILPAFSGHQRTGAATDDDEILEEELWWIHKDCLGL